LQQTEIDACKAQLTASVPHRVGGEESLAIGFSLLCVVFFQYGLTDLMGCILHGNVEKVEHFPVGTMDTGSSMRIRSLDSDDPGEAGDVSPLMLAIIYG